MPQAATQASTVDLDTLLGPHARRSPDMEAVWQWLAEQESQVPDWITLPPGQARALHDGLNARWNTLLPEMAATTTIALPGDVQAELVEPKGVQPGCILFLHGGGWAFGSLATYARFTRLLAEETRTRVLAVNYRLAPEHRFPPASRTVSPPGDGWWNGRTSPPLLDRSASRVTAPGPTSPWP